MFLISGTREIGANFWASLIPSQTREKMELVAYRKPWMNIENDLRINYWQSSQRTLSKGN